MRQEGQLLLILFILASTTNVKSNTFSRTTWCEHKGQNLGTLFSSGTNKYISLDSAKTECLEREDCGGITYDPDSDMYTLRQGETPISGASNEISWTRCTVESTVEKLEISSVEVSQSDSTGVHKLANGDKMIDGDTMTSGVVYLEGYIFSVRFDLELKLKTKAKVHAVIINGPIDGGESSLTLQGKTTYVQTAGSWSSIEDHDCGKVPETNPATLQCAQPIEGDEISFYISKRVHDIKQFTLTVDEIEVYGEVLTNAIKDSKPSVGIIVLIVIGVLAGI